MMLCEKCKKNEATGFYECSQKGAKIVMQLCTRCLLEKRSELLGDFNMFSGFVDTSVKRRLCKTCGTELNKITKTLFVGCPDCYNQLGEQLNPVIRNIQGASAHIGSAPLGCSGKSEIELLKEQLATAIKKERFEDAAILNNRLKGLEDGVGLSQKTSRLTGFKEDD